MRTRNTTLLAVAVIVSIVAGTTVALTHHAPLDLGLGRQASAPAPQAIGNLPAAPPVAVAGSATPQSAAQPVTRRAVRSSSAGQARAKPAASPPASSGYPGQVSCANPDVPSSAPYAWQCTHANDTPVRWARTTIGVWTEGLTPAQSDALHAATAQWTPHTGMALVPAPSSAAAQVVITEVASLDALPDLGPDVVEYAVTEVHQTGGYYDHATMQVANVALLSSDTWLDTMLHELGHVAGLTHVMSPDEIMRRVVGIPQTSYGAGDIAGLETERPR